MNDRDPGLFEAELRRLVPAKPPAELMAKLAEAPVRSSAAHPPRPSALTAQPFWRLLLRWPTPVAALVVVTATLLVWRPFSPEPLRHANGPAAPEQPAVKADDVEIDEQLVASFDAVARLPSGLPIRLRCRAWADETVWRDSARGIVIERQAPRLEVVPVSFETY